MFKYIYINLALILLNLIYNIFVSNSGDFFLLKNFTTKKDSFAFSC